MVRGQKRVAVWLFLLSFFLFFGSALQVESKDFISWKGIVNDIQGPQQGGPSGPSADIPLPGAQISLVNNPAIATVSGGTDGCSSDATCGIFTLSGIPANQFHWIKVTKTNHMPTNIGAQFKDQDVDSTACGPTDPPCQFNQDLFCVSLDMITAVQQRAPNLTVQSGKAVLVVELRGYNGLDLGIYSYSNSTYLKQVAIYLNGSDIPLTPQQYVDIEPGKVFVIPNVSPGTVTAQFTVAGFDIPVVSMPAIADEITQQVINVVDTVNTGLIQGAVTSAGNAVAGATVNAMPDWGTPVSAISGADGTYSLRVRGAPTQYRIQATKDGYAGQYYSQTDRWDWATMVSVAATQTRSGVNFSLTEAHKIAGRVTAGGNTVANTYVNAQSQGQQTSGGSMTDSSGNYAIWIKPATDYKVQVNAQGFAPQFWNNKKGWMDANPIDISQSNKGCADSAGRTDCVDFALVAGKTISGRVTKQDSTPLANAFVNAWSDSNAAGSGMNTDQNGNYSMTVAPASDYRVSVNMPNYPQAFYAGAQSTNQYSQAVLVDVTLSNAANINIQVSSGKSISGTVKTGGVGIANMQVNAFSPNASGSAQTDQSGAFSIKVPPGSGYRIETMSPDYPRVMWKGTISGSGEGTSDSTTTQYDQATAIDIANQDITGIDFVMVTGISVSGSVKTSGNAPVQGAWVNAWSDTAQTFGGGNTDGQGNFSFKVPPAAGYKINVNHPDYPMVFYSGSTDGSTDSVTTRWDQATTFDFTSAGASSIDFVLSTGGSISGTVRANGKAVAGIFVNAFSEQGFGVGQPTNAQGVYTMKVPVGSYRVEIQSDKYVHQFYNGKFDFMQADLVVVAQGSDSTLNRTGIDFNLSTGNSISGNVTFNNNPVPNIWVNAQSDSTMTGGGGMTDSQGNYTINLRPAPDYKVGVWHPDYVPQMYNNKSDWMQADLVDTSSGSRTSINFALSQGATITGTVLASGVPPAADQSGNRGWVNAHSDKTGSNAGAPIQSDGTYILKVSPAPDYRVEVWHPNYTHQFYNNTNKWDAATLVSAMSVTTPTSGINFNLSSGRTISGTITDENGQAKADVWINAFSDQTGSGGGGKTGNDGTYTIPGLAPGAGYRLSVWSNDPSSSYANVFYKVGSETGTADWNQATLIDLTGGNASDKNIKLSAGRSISGSVSASSALTGNIFVDAFSDTLKVGRGEPVRFNAGDTSATYTIKGLPAAGDYRLHIWADNYGNMFYNNTTNWNDATLVNLTSVDATGKNFTLSTGASISGTIYHGSADASNVVRNGWVQAMNPQSGSFQGAPIQQDGTYSIKGLVAGTQYTVQASSAGYMQMFYNGETSTPAWIEPNVTATEAGTTGINIVLSAGYTISGRVFASDGTTPVAGAFMAIYGHDNDDTNLDDNPFFWSPMTDSAGNYRTSPLPAGSYLVGATHPDYGKVFYQNSGNRVITLSSDLADINLTFAASGDLRTISGTVTNSTGHSLNEVQVLAYKCTDDACTDNAKVKATTSKTEKDGGGSITNGSLVTYTLEKLEPGEYKLRLIGLPEPPLVPAMLWYGGTSKTNAAKVNVLTGNATAINGTLQ